MLLVATALTLFLNMLRNVDAACLAIALAVCLNVLNDTDTACVATALAPCLKKKEKIRR